ncbi:MAG: Fe(2+) transporter permease subunit FeoB [Proteobacteria bacterium]|nr:Fe(2+) transporter permease subunit FeoB [Pseudomonadota bacterium]
MPCCKQQPPEVGKLEHELSIALAGNPNCGKSALFNAFTGIRQTTGNWPGVTVERKEGRFTLDGQTIRVIDLPGIYSLDAASLDERVTSDYLLSRDADVVINVVDASNLERNLYLTVQLMEMNVPVIVVLNMMDVARKQGISIDMEKLSSELGCPVLPVVAISGEGLDEVKSAIRSIDAGAASGYSLAHDEVVEQAVATLREQLDVSLDRHQTHWLALKMLEGDRHAMAQAPHELHDEIDSLRLTIAERVGEDADILIADTRYSHAHTLAAHAIKEKGKAGRNLTDHIDRIVLNRWLGIPIFLVVMYLMFLFSINIGGAFIDFFDGVAGAIFVDGFAQLLTQIGMPEWLVVLLANGAGAGVQIVATFIPVITGLYLFLSFVEDSGYMARAAFVMDRAMRTIGLPGKAFVPMIVGFGCNVPAIMATRTLERERERKLTMLMNPFMSCGARLPVYALFAAAFFPSNGQNLVFALYIIGILAAIGTGLIMKRTLLPGQSTGFMMELPPYHMPSLRGVLLRTWDRVKLFLREAGKIIVIMVMVINTLNSIGSDGTFGHDNTDQSILATVSKSLTPVFAPLGIQQDNWPATLGVFTGILAKEVVVGALDSIYTQLGMEEGTQQQSEFDLLNSLKEATATVPANLAEVANSLLDPLGLDVGDLSSSDVAAEDQGVNAGIFGAMASRFDGKIGAFAYLLFILLYFPCVATIGAISREAGFGWAMFVGAWTTGVAYTVSTVFYQGATWARHPASSSAWIIGLLVVSSFIFLAMRRWAQRDISTSIEITQS